MSQFWPLLDESVEVVTPGVGGTCSRLLPAVEEDMVIEWVEQCYDVMVVDDVMERDKEEEEAGIALPTIWLATDGDGGRLFPVLCHCQVAAAAAVFAVATLVDSRVAWLIPSVRPLVSARGDDRRSTYVINESYITLHQSVKISK